MKIDKVSISVIAPRGSLVAFGQFQYGEMFCGSVGIHLRTDGHLNLSFPSRKVVEKNIQHYFPLTEELKQELTKAFEEKAKEIKLLSYEE